jgi:hypothetical protein
VSGKCRRRFLENIVASTKGIHELIKKVRFTVSLLDKKPARKRRVLTEEKVNGIGARLQETPQITLRRLLQETGI